MAVSTRKNILAINEFGTARVVGRSRKSKRTGKFGKERVSIEIQSEPVLFNLDEKVLNEAIAKRQAEAIKRKLEQGGPPLQASSVDAREVAERAYWEDRNWAKRRFSGGRIGQTPPMPGNRNMFKHSGRLAHVTARYVKRSKAWVVNVPANRLNQATFGTPQQFENFLQKFLRFAPLADARKFVKSSEYHRNMDSFLDRVATVVAKNKSLKAARRQAILQTAKALRGFIV